LRTVDPSRDALRAARAAGCLLVSIRNAHALLTFTGAFLSHSHASIPTRSGLCTAVSVASESVAAPSVKHLRAVFSEPRLISFPLPPD
jgi:hypothetical protein